MAESGSQLEDTQQQYGKQGQQGRELDHALSTLAQLRIPRLSHGPHRMGSIRIAFDFTNVMLLPGPMPGMIANIGVRQVCR